jgi:protein CpxP
MKKQFLFLSFTAVFAISASFAQGGGGQRLSPEERTKAAMEKISVLNLDAAAKTKTETVITEFNTSQQKAMEEMRASGSMNRDSMMAKRKVLADARLKEIFTAEQMKKWTEEIEPSLRPQRGGGQRPQ